MNTIQQGGETVTPTPQDMTREEIGKSYESLVGYNPFEDSPEMTTEEGRQLLISYLNED